jgi:hypothetical protein
MPVDETTNLPDKTEFTAACPHLGLADDPATYLAWAAHGNYCHKVHPPQPISLAHQAEVCLRDPARCPVYQQAEWDGPLPHELRRQQKESPPAPQPARRATVWLWVFSILILVVILTSASLMLELVPVWPGVVPAVPTSTPTVTPTATDIPTATPPPSITSSATFLPSPTAIVVPSGTPVTSIEAELAYGSNLRSLPGAASAILRFLDIGTPVTVVGRDALGDWAYVRLPDASEGWIALSQFPDGFTIDSLPYGPDITPLPPTEETPPTP